MSLFPKFTPYKGDIATSAVATNEYLPPVQTVMLGIQHVLAMFGATVLAPILMGFDANLDERDLYHFIFYHDRWASAKLSGLVLCFYWGCGSSNCPRHRQWNKP